MYSPELLRKYHAQICNVLAVSKCSYESLTLDFYSNGIIDELTKCSVLNDQASLQGADNLLGHVKIVLDGSPEKFTDVLRILQQQQMLKSIVQDIRNEGTLSKVIQPQIMQSISPVLRESDHGNATVLIESDDVIHSNAILTHSVTHDNTPYNILKTHTPVLLGIISDPDKLSDDLWAKELLSDGVRDRIKTTLGISRYDKTSMILIDVSRYMMVSDSNDTFIQFCDILINHGQPGLKEIAEKMIALLTD